MRGLYILVLLVAFFSAAVSDHGGPHDYCGGAGYELCKDRRTLPAAGGSPPQTSGSYCLLDMHKDCAYVNTTGSNTKCHPCYLWSDAQSKCSSASPPASCQQGYIMAPDNCTANVWKIWPSKRAWTGFEDMATGKQPAQMNFLWSTLWSSGLKGASNPCSSTHGYKPLALDQAPFGAMLINAYAYRTQHTWHAHLGIAHTNLRDAVDNFLVPAITKAKAWTPTPVAYTWKKTLNGDVESSLWAYLLPVPANKVATATPKTVAALISAAHKNKGPLAKMAPDERNFTGAAVTGAQWKGKPYFAVILFNYYAAWAPDHKKQIGEYELIYHG